MATKVDENGRIIEVPDDGSVNPKGYQPYSNQYTYNPTPSQGYNPQQYQYQQMQDTTPQGQQVSTDAGMRGMTQNTQANNARVQQGYQQGDRVTQAQNQLQQIMSNKPSGYNSKYSQALDNIMQQIQNPEKFQYSFNGDELFKQYADLYTQQGRQASADAMGQAAGLTGGYGNSYAQQAGNQAYQQYLTRLYDRGDQLRNQAFNEWQAGRADDYNRMNALMNADQMDYGRYRDELGDWQADRDWYANAEERAYNRDYNQFAQDRDYWTQQAQLENADWWNAANFNEQMRLNDANRRFQYDQANRENQYRYDTLGEQQAQFGANYGENVRQFDEQMRYNAANFNESVRQFQETSRMDWAKLEENQRQYDASLTEEQRQYDRNIAIKYVDAILANGQMPSPEMLIAAGISQEDANKLLVVLETGGGGGGGGSSSGGRSSGNSGGDQPKQKDKIKKDASISTTNANTGGGFFTSIQNTLKDENKVKQGIAFLKGSK